MAGVIQVASGLRGVAGWSQNSEANVDSELRFYAGWYVVAGALMHQAATNPDLDRLVRPSIEAGWLLGAAGRLLSVRAAGRPDRIFLILAALEIGVAGVLLSLPPPAE